MPQYTFTPYNPFIRWGIIVFAVLIGVVSIVYTNMLVDKLVDREQRQVDLFAKVQSFVINSNENTTFLVTEFVDANYFIPVILTDEKSNPISWRNVEIPEEANKQAYLKELIAEMQAERKPIVVDLGENMKQYIYYKNSKLVSQLRYFPYIQLSFIAVLFGIIYLVFSAARKDEQNRVWVGLAKETAHQLGTPLSSLMAWVEYMRADDSFDQSVATEIAKDVQRLEMITARFSSIGSVPILKQESITDSVENIMSYLEKRISKKVKIKISYDQQENFVTLLNKSLFEWVMENLCKNAVDAMPTGTGSIFIAIEKAKDKNMIQIDITDTGKGIPINQIKTVFKAGFTTKKRGWGLGLTLAQRIVEEYHKGKIWVVRSEINVGTTFRILLPLKTENS
jgi:hypothetical protein